MVSVETTSTSSFGKQLIPNPSFKAFLTEFLPNNRMIRIAEGIWPDEVKESSYFNRGEYRVDENATPTMKNSLMYKMTYVKKSLNYAH